MKKTAIFLVVMLVMSMLVLSSCELISKIPVIGDLINKPCESHVDENGDYICDKCEAELEKNDTPNPPDGPADCEHADADKDHKCDKCGENVGEHKAAEGSHNCAYCGKSASECADSDKNHKCDACSADMGEHKAAEGSHNCAYCGKPASECADPDKNHKCDVCGADVGEHKAAESSHNCAYCGKPASECASADNNHNCDICGEVISQCSDANEDYICDVCGAELERPIPSVTITLEPSEESITPSQGPQNVIIGDFEVILSSEKSRIEGSKKTYTLSDGSTVVYNYRINFNGSDTSFDAASGKWVNAVKFVTGGKGRVTIYWEHCGKGSQGDTSEKAYRNVAIWNEAGEIIAKTEEQYTYQECIITTFEFDAAGTYYIGNLAGANNFSFVEVYYEGEKVSAPEIIKHKVNFSTGEGSAIEPVEVNDTALVTKPADPTLEGYVFNGWYKDEALTTPWNFATDRVTSEITLYAAWKEVYAGEYEEVHYELNISDIETGVRAEDDINGRFTIVSGTEVRSRTKTFEGIEYIKSVKIGGNANKILVSVPGSGKLSFLIQNGSGTATTQFIKVIAPDGTIYDLEFPGTDEGNPVVKLEIEVTEGVWTITRGKNSGTQDIFWLGLDCSVPVSNENGFELVSPGKTDYLVGEELDISKLQLNAIFESGKTDPLSIENVTIDSSAFNKDAAGAYTIVISYKDYEPVSYTVNVYAPTSLKLDFDAIEKIANSAAGNGVYFNHSFKEVYAIGEELANAGLSVTVIATAADGSTKEFRLGLDKVTITGFDSTAAGKQTLTVSYSNVSATVDVHVVDTAPASSNGVYLVKVDKAYDGAIGAVVDGYNMFTTIQQALDYLASRSEIKSADQKLIVIGEGLYTEKLEITIPNLTIRGAGMDKTIIEWDSLYGIDDAGGFTHTTDSTATVAIRDAAVGCIIEDVTISNAYNSKEYFDKTLGENYPEHRALALLVQADRFIMKNSKLLGYQDTLELFKGRQYFKGVEIHGYTDFIFGTNNTTLFEDCVINTIYSGKSNGGYLTAFKGCNKDANDAVLYGAIFYHCKFTADEGVADNLTAIGRPWGAYAAVAVIESELGAHISTVSSGTASQNERYVSMSGVLPTAETVKFVEYKNTGAGAITEAVAGMRFLTDEEAALYVSFATIFGTSNGSVTYLDAWDPTSTEVVVDDRTYYHFDSKESSSGTCHIYDQKLNGTTGTFGDIAIDATKGKVEVRSSDTQINAGAKLTFDVKAGTIVTVITYPSYNQYTLNGVGTNADDTFSQYYAEDTTVVFEALATVYLYQIIINPGEEAPAAPTLEEIKVEGLKTDYLIGDELSLEGVVVKACYSDSSVIILSDYNVDSSAVNNTAAGSYNVVFSSGDNSVTIPVTFVSSFVIEETTVIDLSATGANIQKTTGEYKGLSIDATNGKFADNGGGWAQVNAGTIITFNVKEGAKVSVSAYTSAANFEIVIADGVCTIECIDNDYLKAIIVEYPIVETTTIDLSKIKVTIQSKTDAFGGMIVDATKGKFADNGSGWAQVNAGTVISFHVADGAQVSVNAYTSAANFEIAIANGVCTIKCLDNDYLKAITVKYVVVFSESTAIDLSATGANIQKTTGEYKGLSVDATNGKFADNGGGWTQVNAGTIITLNVANGAQVSVTAYTSAANFEIAVANGVCTIKCLADDYLKAIAIAY